MAVKYYVGVNNTSKVVDKIYIGIGGTAQLCYKAVTPITTVTWADGTITEINSMLEMAYAGDINLDDYWSIGDERIVHCNEYGAFAEQDVVFVLMNKGGKMLADGVTECQYIIMMKDVFKGKTGYFPSIPMNTTHSTAGGWASCTMRTGCCNGSIVNNVMNTDFLTICKEHINKTSNGNGSTVIGNTTDRFAIPSEIEVTGVYTRSYAGEGTQFEYYKTQSHLIKYTHYPNPAKAVEWRLRSCWNQKVNDSTSGYFAYVTINASGVTYYNIANKTTSALSVFTVI